MCISAPINVVTMATSDGLPPSEADAMVTISDSNLDNCIQGDLSVTSGLEDDGFEKVKSKNKKRRESMESANSNADETGVKEPKKDSLLLHFPPDCKMTENEKRLWVKEVCAANKDMDIVLKNGMKRSYVIVSSREAFTLLSTFGAKGVTLQPAPYHGATKIIIKNFPLYASYEGFAELENIISVRRNKRLGKEVSQLVAWYKGDVPGQITDQPNSRVAPCYPVEVYNEPIALCFKCCGWDHYSGKCKRAVCCRFCAGQHDSRICGEKIKSGGSVPRKCANCQGLHNASSQLCKFHPRHISGGVPNPDTNRSSGVSFGSMFPLLNHRVNHASPRWVGEGEIPPNRSVTPPAPSTDNNAWNFPTPQHHPPQPDTLSLNTYHDQMNERIKTMQEQILSAVQESCKIQAEAIEKKISTIVEMKVNEKVELYNKQCVANFESLLDKNEADRLKDRIVELERQNECLKADILNKDNLLGVKESQIAVLTERIAEAERQNEYLKADISNKDNMLGVKESQIAALTERLNNKDSTPPVYEERKDIVEKMLSSTLVKKGVNSKNVKKVLTEMKESGSPNFDEAHCAVYFCKPVLEELNRWFVDSHGVPG